ncbi:SDR family oxidoreductase [Spirosoma sp. BT702]|uniref:SDR family oxidoreductase n=1 Tax=Spirosoma profusum TaxID=2771354 RepID=A0A927GAN5_9BACT|nr:SDR family oxidoreductase [Spirosoma profusum]MBD2705563.1 SDR family oxidoreductase [Spirosoma profusum]
MPELTKPIATSESLEALLSASPAAVSEVPGKRKLRTTTISGPFAGKVAIVTGSESGIGKATARALGVAGAKVILNGRSPERLTQTEAELQGEGLDVVSCLADVTCFDDCERLITTAIDAFGQLDILITNASISMRAYFADMQPDVFRQVLDSNVYGTVYPLKAALPHLTQTKGVVTFISSISALNGMPSGSAYCAGKAALANLAHTLRLELADTGIQVGVVHIGFTQNDSDKRVLDATGQPVPIAHRPSRWQKSQAEVAHIIMNHVRRRRQRTVISALGRLIMLVHTHLPRLGDWIVLTSIRRLRHFYE